MAFSIPLVTLLANNPVGSTDRMELNAVKLNCGSFKDGIAQPNRPKFVDFGNIRKTISAVFGSYVIDSPWLNPFFASRLRAMSGDFADYPPPCPLCSSHLIPVSPIRSRLGITWDRQQRVANQLPGVPAKPVVGLVGWKPGFGLMG